MTRGYVGQARMMRQTYTEGPSQTMEEAEQAGGHLVKKTKQNKESKKMVGRKRRTDGKGKQDSREKARGGEGWASV